MLCFAAIVLACAPEGSLGSDRPAGTDPGDSTGAQPGTESTSTTGSSEGMVDGAVSTSSSTDSSGSSSSGTSEDGATTVIDACAPDAADPPCTTCIKGHCCTEQTACQASEPCTCIEACIADGGEAAGCIDHCGGSDDDWVHLHDCSAEHCIDVC